MTSTTDMMSSDRFQERRGTYVTSGRTSSRAADDAWGQPPASTLVFHYHAQVVVGSDRGVYVASPAARLDRVPTLDDEMAGWEAASDAAFGATGLDL